MNRRTLLGIAALLPAATLFACGTQTPSQIATDVNLIAAGLATTVNSIRQIPGVPTAAVTQIEQYLTTIQADAAQVASATATPATSTVQEISQVVQALASVALPLVPAGSVMQATIQAAVSLLPVILAAVGVSGAGVPVTFLPSQARTILAAAASR
ncbi:hypothetical protein [Rhodopila globiformis]|uniref:Lipoprotein n=1 Tax=Rhodopila globiformis TaxID=1071 RepID=A0A2S6MXK8_RHOGL|nr:hypothetical protein [Rhodopila globiformis]PPQ27079.1 hypothetical protein CCS01_28505 [Rhodopila globiformis]